MTERLASAAIRRLRTRLLPAETRGLLTPILPQLLEKLQRGLHDHQLKVGTSHAGSGRNGASLAVLQILIIIAN